MKQRIDRWEKEENSLALMTLLSAYVRTKKTVNNADYIIQSLTKIYSKYIKEHQLFLFVFDFKKTKTYQLIYV